VIAYTEGAAVNDAMWANFFVQAFDFVPVVLNPGRIKNRTRRIIAYAFIAIISLYAARFVAKIMFESNQVSGPLSAVAFGATAQALIRGFSVTGEALVAKAKPKARTKSK